MKPIVVALCVATAACASASDLVGPVPSGLLSSPQVILANGAPVMMSGIRVSADRRAGASVLALLQTTTGPNPGGISAGRVWLVHDGLAWNAQASPVVESLTQVVGAIEEFVAGGGPQWPVGDSVDVVVEVRDSSGLTQLVRGPRQVINPADPVSLANEPAAEIIALGRV
jgi:hypothetical protein